MAIRPFKRLYFYCIVQFGQNSFASATFTTACDLTNGGVKYRRNDSDRIN